jgi:hypothetical protein
VAALARAVTHVIVLKYTPELIICTVVSSAQSHTMGERLDLSKPRYDQSTYIGRVKHYFEVTDPRTILASDKRERPPKFSLPPVWLRLLPSLR